MGRKATASTSNWLPGRWARLASRGGWPLVLLAAAALADRAAAQPPPAADKATINRVLRHNSDTLNAELTGVPNTPEVITVGPVTINFFYNAADKKLAVRKKAVIDGINKLLSLGFQFPNTVNIVLKPTIANDAAAVAHTLNGHIQAIVISEGCDKLSWPPGSPRPSSYSSVDASYRDQVFKEHHKSWIPKPCDKWAQRKAKDAQCMATATHELCHLLHYGQNLAGAVWNAMTGNANDPHGGWAMAAPLVSAYAADDRNEFIAEVCAGLALGYTYPPHVLNAYVSLGGPAPNVPYTPLPPHALR